MAAGGGGSSGAGKETAGATTPSDLNNFQFQERKRELEKYRRAIWQRDGKRRLRGPGSVLEHLWTLQRLRENGSRIGGGPRRDNSDPVQWANWGLGALRLLIQLSQVPQAPMFLLSSASGRSHYVVVIASLGFSETPPHSSN